LIALAVSKAIIIFAQNTSLQLIDDEKKRDEAIANSAHDAKPDDLGGILRNYFIRQKKYH
jgi:hypothetical protein